MNSPIVPFLIFVFVTTFTPGPNNISSAVMGLNYGYRKTFSYLLGIFCGFILLMCVCAFLSAGLLSALPEVEKYIAIIGALYILWLAWHTLRSNYEFNEQKKPPLTWLNGFLLQLLNPKVIIYGITIYSTFLKELPKGSLLLPLTAAGLAFNSFISISLWTLFGTFIRRFMKNQKLRGAVNIILALLLVFTAVQISGILN